jgi:hypothetical protein
MLVGIVLDTASCAGVVVARAVSGWQWRVMEWRWGIGSHVPRPGCSRRKGAAVVFALDHDHICISTVDHFTLPRWAELGCAALR